MASLTVALTLVLALLSSSVHAGVFALTGGTAQATSQMHVSGNGTNDLDLVQYARGSRAPITRYDLEETKPIHLILVRDDFRTFAHLHPILKPNGHFGLQVALDAGHRYYAYADTKPHGMSQQVFRYELVAGTPPRRMATSVSGSLPYVYAGPYGVRLATTRIAANRPQTIHVTITRGRALANDLRPYLGAAAHGVLINTATLAYVHVHPISAMNGTEMPSLAPSAHVDGRIGLQTPPLKPGTYKMWLQFAGKGGVFVAPFTLAVR